MERKSLEQQIFTWEEWNEGADTADTIFYDVVLTVPVGEFPVGTKFESAYFAGSSSLVFFMDNENKEHGFELNISVGNKQFTRKI